MKSIDDLRSRQACSRNACCETAEHAFLNGKERLDNIREEMEPYWRKGKPVPQEMYERERNAMDRAAELRRRLAPGGMTIYADGAEKPDSFYY